MFGASIRHDAQVRPGTFTFRAMLWFIHSLLMLLHAAWIRPGAFAFRAMLCFIHSLLMLLHAA